MTRTYSICALGALLSGLVALGAGCGGSQHRTSSVQQVVARVGDLEIIHPFLPDPANPTVAAVYLTVRDNGPTPDRLVSATTPLTKTTMLMTEDIHGSMDTMAPLPALVVPAHQEASLSPGHDHLMLENLRTTFKVGEHVQVTLTFQRAGHVTVSVPVVPLTDILNDGGAGAKGMNMAGM